MSLFTLLAFGPVAFAGPPAPSTSTTPSEPSGTEDCDQIDDEVERAACMEKGEVEEIDEPVEELRTNPNALKGAKSPSARKPGTRGGE